MRCTCTHSFTIFFSPMPLWFTSFKPIEFTSFMHIRLIKSVLKTTLTNKISISAWEGTGPFQSLYTNKYDNFAEIIFPTWTKRLIFLISLYFLFIECKCQFKFIFYFVVINSLMQKIKCIPTAFNEKNRSIVLAHFLMSDIRCVYFRHFSLFLSLWLHDKLYRYTFHYTGT